MSSLVMSASNHRMMPWLVIPLLTLAASAVDIPIDAFSDANRARWMVEVPKEGAGTAFTFEMAGGQQSIVIKTGELDPARSTVRILLPGDGPRNGAEWEKAKARFISFYCMSDKPVDATFHLLERGKTAGTFQARFSATPGEWRRVILPMEDFKLKSFSAVAGIGVRAVAGQPAATIRLRGFSAGAPRFTDESFRGNVGDLPLKGPWKFKTDAGEEGMAGKWFEEKFDDSAWRNLNAGAPWETQGIDHFGWGWYRREVVIPATFRGLSPVINLANMRSDDECWFNGRRVGGLSSEYHYYNMQDRQYAVPAEWVKWGEPNTIVVRCWGGNKLTFIGANSGLIAGTLSVVLDPYQPTFNNTPYQRFDLSDAQRGMAFNINAPLAEEVVKAATGGRVFYEMHDFFGEKITSGALPLAPTLRIAIDAATSRVIYQRGRFKLSLRAENKDGGIVYASTRDFDRLNFDKRDSQPLPELPPKFEQTPYGNLRLIDEIDASTPIERGIHPYLEGGFNNAGNWHTPGSKGSSFVTEILGKQARDSGYGWFAYRIGRGKLKPRATYLVRIEYPEDKPRFGPIEFQTGQNFYDVGWKSGVAPDDVYDNWPLSGKWEWYDAIVPLDNQTVGTGGPGSASAENGLWVYFMNKMKPGQYYAMWEGGPAVARIKLYEIDPEQHAPVIRWPDAGVPRRTLAVDWERQADHVPEDIVKYAKLMGYSAVSPIMLKWFFANYADPFPGYDSMWIDARDYWAHTPYEKTPNPPAVSQHARYLETTKKWNIDYIPRVEWGGSQLLAEADRAVAPDGKLTKPNRFAPWCANLLKPATLEDYKKYIEHIIAPYAADNPQLRGIHWRIRCQRLPPSYSEADLKLFADETGAKLPAGTHAQQAAWAATGEGRAQYDDWWHGKRAKFHADLVEHLRGFRDDLRLWYFNWDPDKMGIIEPDITQWAFIQHVINAGDKGRDVYVRERALRKSYTAADYIAALRIGDFSKLYGINRADMGIRPELYKNIPGIEIFALAHYLCYLDPALLEYFRTAEGVAASHCVSYDEIGARTINPKYEGNMLTPGNGDFSMALELITWFHSDARTLNYTVYTYGRGFADAHRRFAQAYLALPATDGVEAPQGDADVKARVYGNRVGVGYKGHATKTLAIKIPAPQGVGKITNLVTGENVPFKTEGNNAVFEINAAPMSLHAYEFNR